MKTWQRGPIISHTTGAGWQQGIAFKHIVTRRAHMCDMRANPCIESHPVILWQSVLTSCDTRAPTPSHRLRQWRLKTCHDEYMRSRPH